MSVMLLIFYFVSTLLRFVFVSCLLDAAMYTSCSAEQLVSLLVLWTRILFSTVFWCLNLLVIFCSGHLVTVFSSLLVYGQWLTCLTAAAAILTCGPKQQPSVW